MTPPLDLQQIPSRLQAAIQLHQAGRYAEAEALYRQILAAQPDHLDALHLLGLIALQARQYGPAEELIRRAIALQPRIPHLHFNLAEVFRAAGKLPDALASLDQAILLKPDFVEAHCNRGVVLKLLYRPEEALAAYQRAYELRPVSGEIRLNRALAMLDAGQTEAAARELQTIETLQPPAQVWTQVAGAWRRLSRSQEACQAYQRALNLNARLPDVWTDFGALLHDLGRLDEAIHAHSQAIALHEAFPRAHYNLGNALYAAHRFDEASAAFHRAVELRPDYAAAWNNLGNTRRKRGDADAALAAYDQAIRHDPHLTRAHCNRGILLYDLGRLEEAMAAFDAAIAAAPSRNDAPPAESQPLDALYNQGVLLGETGRENAALDLYQRALNADPNLADAHWNRSLILLLHGDLPAGFKEYEWRWHARDFHSRNTHTAVPQWDGCESPGCTLLLHAEQGLGDTLQFIRYLPLVLPRVGRVIVECQPELQRLLAASLPVPVIARGDTLPPFDLQLPLLSLPFLLGATLDNIPHDVPYLKVPPDVRAAWQARFAADEPLAGQARKIGLAWAGNPAHGNDARRSMPLSALTPLFDLPNILWVSLQKGPGRKQVDNAMPLLDLGPHLHDFADTAAVIDLLDLVLCVDTSVAHLAGALARPFWLLLPHQPEWRWLRERTDSPWYPTARLFRQAAPGDWPGLVQTVRAAMAAIPAAPP